MVIMFATPVGPYFKGGFKPTKVCISRDYDRVAPQGTGAIKIGGNYAASLNAGQKAHELGYSVMLYLDPKRKQISRRVRRRQLLWRKRQHIRDAQLRTVLPSITNKEPPHPRRRPRPEG